MKTESCWYYLLRHENDVIVSANCFSDPCFAQTAGASFKQVMGLDRHTLIIVTEEYIDYFKKSLIKEN